MNYISENTKTIEHSKIRKMFNKALEFHDPISFTVGEPDFTPPAHVIEAAVCALKEGKTKYSENAGIKPLREAISRYLEREIGLSYNPVNEIVVTTGGMGGIFQTMKVVLNPGDEVIINEPCWTNYAQQIKMCGGVPVSVPVDFDNNFAIDPEKIEKSITNNTKAIIINSPCNPTGAVLSKDILEKVAEIAKAKDILVFSDEVYKHIIFDGAEHVSIASLPGMKERTIIFDSFSKTFAMTGLRVGYVAGPSEVVANITKLQENVAACVAMPCQYAAIAALDGSKDHLDMMVSQYKKRRDYIFERLSKMPYVEYEKSKGSFYAFISIKKTGMTSEEFAMKLLEAEQVVVVPGDAFGSYGEGYIRISFATSMENIQKGMDGIERFLRRI